MTRMSRYNFDQMKRSIEARFWSAGVNGVEVVRTRDGVQATGRITVGGAETTVSFDFPRTGGVPASFERALSAAAAKIREMQRQGVLVLDEEPVSEPAADVQDVRVVEFHGAEIQTFDVGGVPHVALKPIVEAMGMDWEAQHKRVSKDAVLSTCISLTEMQVGGQRRRVTTLPLDYLNGFLFGIDASRVKPEVRETVIAYQRECYRALADYWLRGKAERPVFDGSERLAQIADQTAGIRQDALVHQERAEGAIEDAKVGIMGYVKRHVLGGISTRLDILQGWLHERFAAEHARDKMLIEGQRQTQAASLATRSMVEEIRTVIMARRPAAPPMVALFRLIAERTGEDPAVVTGRPLRVAVDDATRFWTEVGAAYGRNLDSKTGYPLIFDPEPFDDWWSARGERVYRGTEKRSAPVLTLVTSRDADTDPSDRKSDAPAPADA